MGESLRGQDDLMCGWRCGGGGGGGGGGGEGRGNGRNMRDRGS